jgi:hypothetical protein
VSKGQQPALEKFPLLVLAGEGLEQKYLRLDPFSRERRRERQSGNLGLRKDGECLAQLNKFESSKKLVLRLFERRNVTKSVENVVGRFCQSRGLKYRVESQSRHNQFTSGTLKVLVYQESGPYQSPPNSIFLAFWQ